MATAFGASFITIFYAMMKIGIVALLASVLVRKKVITDNDINTLSNVTINVLLPCLVISSFIKNFNPSGMTWWYLLPLAGFIHNIFGFALGRLFFGSSDRNGDMIAMSSLQNAGYLILPLGQSIFPGQFDAFANICFLYLVGTTPVLWSAGKILVGKDTTISIKNVLNPPLVAIFLGIGLVLSNLGTLIPDIFIDAMDFTGSATVPVATFILGATLGQINIKKMPGPVSLSKMAVIKYILLPAATWQVLLLFDVAANFKMLAAFLMMEAAAPPATALILISRSFDGDTQTIGATMLFAYFCCIIAIPLWVSIAVKSL